MSVTNPLDKSYSEYEDDEYDVSPFARSENLPQKPKTSNTQSGLSYPTDTSITTNSSNKSSNTSSSLSYPTDTSFNTNIEDTFKNVNINDEPQQPQQPQPQQQRKPKPQQPQQQYEQQRPEQTQQQQQQQTQENTSIETSSIKRPQWVPDNSSNKCEMCQSEFTFFNRRHHCRRCGHLFCSDCCGLNVSLPQEFGYTERVKVCSKCFTVTLQDRAKEESSVTINIGGVSKETKVVNQMNKVLLWKMGAHEDGDFDRTVADSLESQPNASIPVSRVQDIVLDQSDLDVQGCTGFKVRVYNPALEPGEKGGIYPILMWFHTGGFVCKSAETPSVDGLCRLLSNQARCVVVSVDYRLAPEHPFPAAALDCFAATCWAIKRAASFDGDPTRVVVAGDSVGGNLAAAVCLMARDKGSPRIIGQVLIYPILDLKRNEEKYYTRVVHNEGYLMPMSYFKWFSSKYCKDGDIENPYASPLRAATTTKSLTGLPVTLVLTAGWDPFCDEGELYVKKLRSSGVKTYHTRYTNSPHGFFAIGLDESNEAVMEVSIALKYMFKRLY
ncbi:Esterase [Tieghemostelium lacteum]|uniref:Esterase n=1 Tax=Tieghemostelium lacteum TaxID=361077 RepID=A0A152A4E6_TIELA|nr:Esterase [Tieghemostelium lacteum]|eukprot:KYR01118.1 Esterase [Tieghemostelium lacteum]